MKKKKPSDYPLFSFRLTNERKAELDRMVGVVLKRMNAGLNKDDKRVPKNLILFRALKIGLARVSKDD